MKLFLCYTRNTIDIDVISEIPYEKAEGFAPGNSYEGKTETIKWLREEMGMELIESGYYFFCKYDSEVDRVDITYVIKVYHTVGGPFSELSNLEAYYRTELFIYDKIFTGAKIAIDEYLTKSKIEEKILQNCNKYPVLKIENVSESDEDGNVKGNVRLVFPKDKDYERK